jgi:CRISPR-associated protein Csx10
MQKIQVLIEAQSPLALGRQKTGSSISDVEQYIPGTVLRGAIAGMLLRQAQAEGRDFSQEPDSDFKALFIDNQAIFQNAYPALTQNLKLHSEVRVLPTTALSSKNDPGFKTEDKNGVFDSLIAPKPLAMSTTLSTRPITVESIPMGVGIAKRGTTMPAIRLAAAC